MESIMDCATVEALRGSDEPSIRCDMITEPVVLLGQEPELGFGASIVGPSESNDARNIRLWQPTGLMHFHFPQYTHRETETR